MYYSSLGQTFCGGLIFSHRVRVASDTRSGLPAMRPRSLDVYRTGHLSLWCPMKTVEVLMRHSLPLVGLMYTKQHSTVSSTAVIKCTAMYKEPLHGKLCHTQNTPMHPHGNHTKQYDINTRHFTPYTHKNTHMNTVSTYSTITYMIHYIQMFYKFSCSAFCNTQPEPADYHGRKTAKLLKIAEGELLVKLQNYFIAVHMKLSCTHKVVFCKSRQM